MMAIQLCSHENSLQKEGFCDVIVCAGQMIYPGMLTSGIGRQMIYPGTLPSDTAIPFFSKACVSFIFIFSQRK